MSITGRLPEGQTVSSMLNSMLDLHNWQYLDLTSYWDALSETYVLHCCFCILAYWVVCQTKPIEVGFWYYFFLSLLFHRKLGFSLEICVNQRNILLTGYIPKVLCFVSGLSGSRYKMEYAIDKCSELDQNIDLSSLNLTALYNCHYLSCVHTVDLSSNDLSSCSLPQLHPLQRCQVGGNMFPEAPCIFNLSIRWRWVIRFMHCIYLWETVPVAIDGMVGKPWLSSS